MVRSSRNRAAAKQEQAQPSAKPESEKAVSTYLVRDAIRDVGGKAGKMILGREDLGRWAGAGVSKLMGFGDYRIVSNSIMKGSFISGRDQQAPDFVTSGRNIRVIEKEYIGDVISSTTIGAFNNNSYRINPGVSATFPWLSTIASSFDQYQVNGLVFSYRSTSSEFNGSSQALGTVIMATEYDPTDADFTSKAVMENSQFCMSAKASSDLYHGVECSMKERPTNVLYVADATTTGEDLRLTDLGNFQLATQGCSVASVNLGELWVSYDITLLKKQLPLVLALNGKITNGSVGLAQGAIFGTDGGFIYGTLDVAAVSNTITFYNLGQYIIGWSVGGTTLAGTPAYTVVNCTAATLQPLLASGGSTSISWTTRVNVIATPATLTLTGVTAATVTTAIARIGAYEYALA